MTVKRGDRFVADSDTAERSPTFIEVTRVAKDGSWADLQCLNWAVMWTGRQPLPMPPGARRECWTFADVDSYIPEGP